MLEDENQLLRNKLDNMIEDKESNLNEVSKVKDFYEN